MPQTRNRSRAAGEESSVSSNRGEKTSAASRTRSKKSPAASKSKAKRLAPSKKSEKPQNPPSSPGGSVQSSSSVALSTLSDTPGQSRKALPVWLLKELVTDIQLAGGIDHLRQPGQQLHFLLQRKPDVYSDKFTRRIQQKVHRWKALSKREYNKVLVKFDIPLNLKDLKDKLEENEKRAQQSTSPQSSSSSNSSQEDFEVKSDIFSPISKEEENIFSPPQTTATKDTIFSPPRTATATEEPELAGSPSLIGKTVSAGPDKKRLTTSLLNTLPAIPEAMSGSVPPGACKCSCI